MKGESSRNSASVWLAPPEMDSPGAGIGNGVGVGAALKAALKGRFKGPFKGRNTAASADQLVVMRNYGIFGERRNFFRPPLRGAIHTEAPLIPKTFFKRSPRPLSKNKLSRPLRRKHFPQAHLKKSSHLKISEK